MEAWTNSNRTASSWASSSARPTGKWSTPLDAGDRFLLYTDGLIEAANAADDLFGLERLKLAFAAADGLESHAVVDAPVDDLDTWSGQPPADDLTIVLVDWTSER